jgi:predicted AAA+ superfamily ATPase
MTIEAPKLWTWCPVKASALIAEALADTRVVTLNGARQAGKSTLVRLAASASPDAVVRLLDDPATLSETASEPSL